MINGQEGGLINTAAPIRSAHDVLSFLKGAGAAATLSAGQGTSVQRKTEREAN